jgi:hypothetical protein|uniref:Uncharacterized protein n=1 Tax=Myoviridae sp. ct5xZ3 TaxID=2827601 RepID=A0A8S5RRK3_9CAUD|nr:MAG TPA: hypothetical protein [Myoviridae sp. ct5xZ3]
MNVIKVTEGEYIDYSVSKSKVTFADELTLNLEKRERDFDVSIDVCIDRDGAVTAGQLGVKYAAQIEIPAREYTEEEVSNPDYDPEDSTSKETIINKVPVPFSMNNVTLKLYAI